MNTNWIELLYEALRADRGIIVKTEDAAKLRQKLYPIRAANPELAPLSFRISPTSPDTELWIMKK